MSLKAAEFPANGAVAVAANAANAESGVILIDKPAGMTSHDVVAAVRGRLGGAKTGHAGTLDPFATGLLIVLFGRATRIQRQMMALPKRYEVLARLGARSSTGDPEGEIEITGAIPPDPPPLPTGELLQRPPIYSAVKVGGERAYRRARRGERFEMPPRQVHVERFEQLWREQPAEDSAPGTVFEGSAASDGVVAGRLAALPRAAFLVECSAGTYVRSLIADLGDAYCEQLRRTRIGPFVIDRAAPAPQRGADWQPREVLSIEQALGELGD